MKLIYFGGIIDNAASVDPVMMAIAITASIAGTTAARRILEAMSDKQFRVWATRIINSISSYYVLQGSYLLLAPLIWRAV
jgi:CRISPR/Cas system type I-B associated protein Csh2 (Cas7 group RAMP superfamily)